MQTTETSHRTDLTKRAADIVPVLRKNSLWQEENRRLADESVEAMTAAGIFRMRTAARFGGYEADAHTLLDVGIELGRGDGAAAFDVAAWWITSWNVGLFPDEVQDEIFADPDARISGTLALNGTGVPKDGGIVVNGEWAFNSGAAHSGWKLLSTLLIPSDGEPEPVMAVVPMSALRIVDDWHVSALSGTGSVRAVAEDVFVPGANVMRIAAFTAGEYASERNRDLPMFQSPLVAAVAASTSGKMIGMARAAQEQFYARINERPISNTNYERQADAPITHLQAADAALKIDEAEGHARRLATLVDERGLTREPWTIRDRAYARAVAGRVPQLTAEAVDILAGACGASSIYTSEPIQRIRRDVRAVTLHALHLPTTTMELYGRVLCGLEPNTFFI
ncbi:acyl-CoA dehydrogenase [Micromonospora sp. NPDC049114]|uniref:acyl-CoA dehydrogenase n=1 Tax=unclassified Micromonospora TaxID=2617518 RepID=UPI001F2A0C2D|nr:acyl-CoA dehydrogenase [Micromonospora sp. MH99]MCF0093052.1 Flavin-dependent monooxygenase, oxygenase subunit HsaA [Micromonospora sp. MH99]